MASISNKIIVLCCCFVSTTFVWGQNGKHFVFPEYQEGQIVYKNKKVNKVELNYNKATEEMVYTGSDGKKMALHPIDQIDTIYFEKRSFIPSGNSFEEVLLSGKYPLYASYHCRLSIGAQNIGYGSSSTTAIDNISSLNTGGEMYQLKLPENYKVEPYTIYTIEINGKRERFRRIKEVIKIFPERKKEIMNFQKKNKLKNDNEGIIQLIQHISSL